jgi:predicted alpha/beta superfamily hydrolase
MIKLSNNNVLINVLMISFLFLSCKNRELPKDPIPEHTTFTIQSVEVKEERVINVWLPKSYKTSNESYPVLYMADGGIKEDFPHIANTLSELIEQKKINPIVLVGIENTDRRRDLTGSSVVKDDAKYCPLTDGAKDFRNFIGKELIPKIESEYRTNNQKGIIGESLSGLFVMETLMEHPEMFNFYIAFDPSLWWNAHYLVQQADSLFSSFPDQGIKLWFAGSDAEDISVYTNKLNDFLTKSSPSQLDWKYSDEPKEHHHTIFRATKEKALIWTLK